ncbi:vacuolar fusion protein MON1 homolog [Bidens hawaiensis]|uniref:vacuolar fusion protein MON1 homolog n=1 Tax=Bidens hawaiensis TaxID=980011 RepID=UPI0040495DA4
MTSDSSSCLSSFSDEEEEEPKSSDHQIGSIDYSLDAIENQLSSIAFNNNSSIDQQTPSVSDDDHHTDIANGATNEIETQMPTGADDIQEIEDNNNNIKRDGGEVLDDSVQSQWGPGKRHAHEDDGSMSWRERKKHFFVLSNSGKPIFSRYGDEHKLAGFSATLQAIISFVEDGGDHIKLVKAGNHQLVFLVKKTIYLACISCTDEPYESLRGQLELLYGQMILILTKSVNKCFERNPKFDMAPLLGGTDVVLSSLFHSFSWNPATFLHAYTCLPLPYATRQVAATVLQDVADSGVLFAMLMCKHKVISLVGARKAVLHPDDMLLLANFVMSTESFRTSESFSPICLPRYNPMAFLLAYVHFFYDDTYLVLLTSSSNAFFHLKDCRILIEKVLLKNNVLSEVQRSLSEGGMRVEKLHIYPSTRSESLHLNEPRPATVPQERSHESVRSIGGPAGLWHFIYRNMSLDQYVSSEFSSPITSHQQQKRLYRAYQKLYASMHDKAAGPQKTQFKQDDDYVLLCWVTQDFELYAAFDPLADKGLAIRICNRVCEWVKDVENEIFLQAGSPSIW